MKNLVSLAASLMILALLQTTGMLVKYSLSHPFWETKATLIGAAAGVVITFIVIWIFGKWQSIAPMFSTLIGILFIFIIVATWYFARVFIDSEVFEPLAGKIWFFGYHGFVALFVLNMTLVIRKYFP